MIAYVARDNDDTLWVCTSEPTFVEGPAGLIADFVFPLPDVEYGRFKDLTRGHYRKVSVSLSLETPLAIKELVEQLRASGYECLAGRFGDGNHFLALKGLSVKERAELSRLTPHVPADLLAFEQRRACSRCRIVFLNVEGDCPVCYYRQMAGKYGRRMAKLLEEKKAGEQTP